MNDNDLCAPACAKVKSGNFLPVVFVAHDAVYFCGDGYQYPNSAIEFAQMAIATGEFRTWHYHNLSGEPK